MSTALKCLIILLMPVLMSCQGASAPSGQTSAVLQQGRFIDSHVQGLSFSSIASSGVTDANGVFTFAPGSVVTFAVGDIVLGSARGQAVVTPVDLVPFAVSIYHPTVVNIARFLQSIDNDANASNGIVITPALRTLSQNRQLDFSQPTLQFISNAQRLVNELTTATDAGGRDLISEQATIEHLDSSLRTITAEIQGVNGSVVFYQGDFMPCVGSCTNKGTVTPVSRTVLVFPLIRLDQAKDLGGGFFSDIQTAPVTEVVAGDDGRFAIRLPAGSYSLLVREGDRYYANQLSGPPGDLPGDTANSATYIFPVVVAPGQATNVLFRIDYLATY